MKGKKKAGVQTKINQYTVVSRVGEGAFGDVMKVTETKDNVVDVFAMKIM
jgi:hypothetical protein